MSLDAYEGSARQRKQKRRVKVIGVVLALALLVPIVISTAAAIGR